MDNRDWTHLRSQMFKMFVSVSTIVPEVWQALKKVNPMQRYITATRKVFKPEYFKAAFRDFMNSFSELLQRNELAIQALQGVQLPTVALAESVTLPTSYQQASISTQGSHSVVFENDFVRLSDHGEGIAVLSFKSKMNTASGAVLDGLLCAVEQAEAAFSALVIWQYKDRHFCLGADLREFAKMIEEGASEALESAVAKFQRASMALQQSSIPTVAAVQGMALGGGCELLMHCDRVVALSDSRIGLVEAGVGLLPAGGGCKELLLRALRSEDQPSAIKNAYLQVASGKMAPDARAAQTRGFLRETDVLIDDESLLLTSAIAEAQTLAGQDQVTQHSDPLSCEKILSSQVLLEHYKSVYPEHSAYDAFVAEQIAQVFSGGDASNEASFDEAKLLQLEREYFVKLCFETNTQARIAHTLETGKLLKN